MVAAQKRAAPSQPRGGRTALAGREERAIRPGVHATMHARLLREVEHKVTQGASSPRRSSRAHAREAEAETVGLTRAREEGLASPPGSLLTRPRARGGRITFVHVSGHVVAALARARDAEAWRRGLRTPLSLSFASLRSLLLEHRRNTFRASFSGSINQL